MKCFFFSHGTVPFCNRNFKRFRVFCKQNAPENVWIAKFNPFFSYLLFEIAKIKPSKLLSRPKSWNWVPIRCNQNDGEILCLRALKAPLAKRSAVGAGDDNNNNVNELYLHDHTSTYSIAKAIFRNQNYNTGQLRYFDNNLSRTSKQAEIYVYW